MPISYGDGGTKRSIKNVYYQDGGTRRTIKKIWYGEGGTNRLVYSGAISLAPIANLTLTGGSPPTLVDGHPVPGHRYTGSRTANASGGSGSYTYSLTRVSGSTSIVGSVSGNTLDFYRSGSVSAASATFKCTATDGNTSASVTFTVN